MTPLLASFLGVTVVVVPVYSLPITLQFGHVAPESYNGPTAFTSHLGAPYKSRQEKHTLMPMRV
jgi:hypothetical protein